MKKLSGVFICLLLFTVLSSARIIEVADAGITDKLKAVIAAKNAGGGGCSYADTLIGGDNSSGGSGGWNTAFWVAIQFTVGEEHTCVRKIKVLEHADGDSCASVKSGYAILGDTGGNKPDGNVITSGTASVSYTGDAGITEVVDLGAGNEVTLATGTYWIAFIYSDVAQSETCGMKTPYVTSGAPGWLCEMSSSNDSDTVPADWSSSSCSPAWGLGLAVYE